MDDAPQKPLTDEELTKECMKFFAEWSSDDIIIRIISERVVAHLMRCGFQFFRPVTEV